ncbi:MAG: MarC family protein [Candidatus Contendobacter sp.]
MSSFLSTFAATLFALLNPLGMLPVFIGYTADKSKGVQRWLALFVSMTVLALMIVFLITGETILKFFGITLDSFRMAGGILLLLIGIHIVLDDSTKAVKELASQAQVSALSEAKLVYRQIVVPFAMPLLVGPGVIANLILYASEAEAAKNDAMLLGLIGVTVAISLLCFIILSSGRVLQRLLGDVGLSIFTRILGLLVASIGMQFIITGLSNVIIHSIVPEVLKIH